MRLNMQIFHNFFYYTDKTERGKSATHYSKGNFFSYGTQIGLLYSGNGRPVCFIADNNFSRTTAAHISALARACPHPIIRVPFEYEDDFSSNPDNALETLKSRFLSDLKSYAPENFTRKPARDGFNEKLHHFRAFLECTGEKIPLREQRVLETLETAADETPESKTRRAEAARKRAEKTRKENERKARELKKILKKWNVCTLTEKARFAFQEKAAPEVSEKLRKLLRADFPGFSFAWIDGNTIKTSQGVTMELATAQRAYSLFTAGKLASGMHIGPYTIREIASEFVRIGCHKLAMQNITEIASEF